MLDCEGEKGEGFTCNLFVVSVLKAIHLQGEGKVEKRWSARMRVCEGATGVDEVGFGVRKVGRKWREVDEFRTKQGLFFHGVDGRRRETSAECFVRSKVRQTSEWKCPVRVKKRANCGLHLTACAVSGAGVESGVGR